MASIVPHKSHLLGAGAPCLGLYPRNSLTRRRDFGPISLMPCSHLIEAETIAAREVVLSHIQRAITACTADRGYELVLDASGMSLNGLAVVLRASGATDITDEVVNELQRIA